MKSMILSLAFLASANAFAAQPASETVIVSRLLLHVPQVVQVLQANATDRLTNIEKTDLGRGVTEYVLTYEIGCFCMQKTSTVTITEDTRPAMADGPVIYTGTVTVK